MNNNNTYILMRQFTRLAMDLNHSSQPQALCRTITLCKEATLELGMSFPPRKGMLDSISQPFIVDFYAKPTSTRLTNITTCYSNIPLTHSGLPCQVKIPWVHRHDRILHQHMADIFNHYRKARERRYQSNKTLQACTSTSTRLPTQKSTMPTHTTQGRFPFSTRQSLRKALPCSAIKLWAQKDNHYFSQYLEVSTFTRFTRNILDLSSLVPLNHSVMYNHTFNFESKDNYEQL